MLPLALPLPLHPSCPTRGPPASSFPEDKAASLLRSFFSSATAAAAAADSFPVAAAAAAIVDGDLPPDAAVAVTAGTRTAGKSDGAGEGLAATGAGGGCRV